MIYYVYVNLLQILAAVVLTSAAPEPGVHFSVHSSPYVHGLQPPLYHHPVHSVPIHTFHKIHTPIVHTPIVHPIVHRPIHHVPIVHTPLHSVPIVHAPVHTVPIHPIIKVKSHYW